MTRLSAPGERELLHTRTVTCHGYRRADGLYDIEGHLVDSKSYDFSNRDRGGKIRAGESLHEMRVRITLDLSLTILDAEALTEWAPYRVCQNATASFKGIIGITIGPGWRQQVNRIIGRQSGCTHITELLSPMATTAYQTIGAEWQEKNTGKSQDRPPPLLNTCYAYADDGPIIKREWPNWYKSKNR